MKLNYHEIETLPKLAWCAVINKRDERIYVYHGSGVEIFEDFFVEGAWDGDFESGEFQESDFFLGTGGKLLKTNELLFAAPNHTLERLFSIVEKTEIYISNSLPFILVMSKSSLDIDYLDYETDFNSILNGINKYKKVIPLLDDKKLQLHYYCNVLINREFQLKEEPKKNTCAFKDFDDYYTILMDMLRKFVSNATSLKRKSRYGMVTTISKGYDAAASAALAKEIGCDTAVTFNSPQKYADDCGEDIAKLLGYTNIVKKSADHYLKNTSLVEAEFLSSGELGTGIVFTAFENEFENKVVFVGERGDKIWDKNRTDVNNELRFENEVFSGTSMIENRLRVGYIILPVPLFGAKERPSIHNISNSADMEPYSIGGNYDRPIPRRIIEARGVPRKMFGMEKKGAGFNYRYDNLSRIKKRISEKSFEDFYYYYINNRRRGLKVTKQWFKFIWNTRTLYLHYFLKKIGLGSRIKRTSVTADAISNPGAPYYLFYWGVHVMTERYRRAISEKFKRNY